VYKRWCQFFGPPCILCHEFKDTKYEVTAEALLIKLTTLTQSINQSSVIIIITIIAYHCSLFKCFSDCHHMLLCKNSRLFTLPVDNEGNFIFHIHHMLFSFPLELFPFPLVAQNYSHSHPHGNGSSFETFHSHEHLYSAEITSSGRLLQKDGTASVML